MILQPANRNELPRLLADENTGRERISAFDLTALNRVLEHKAEDMTARVEAGMTLAALQAQLADASIQLRRLSASVLLVKALGGGWRDADLQPSGDSGKRGAPAAAR